MRVPALENSVPQVDLKGRFLSHFLVDLTVEKSVFVVVKKEKK
jgi:hypothetical protein